MNQLLAKLTSGHFRMLLGYLLFLVCLMGAVIYAGAVDQVRYGHDFFGGLEGSWKIINGFRPYIDFSTAVGVWSHLILVLGMVITGPSPQAFSVSNAITLLPIGALTWYVLSNRIEHWVIKILALSYACLVWAAPYPLHYDFWETSYAMIYNRQGSVILMLLMALIFEYKKDHFLMGFLLGFLFFLKITFCIAGCILFVKLFIYNRITRKEIALIIGGVSLSIIPILIYLDGLKGVMCMISILRNAALARSPDIIEAGMALVAHELPNPFLGTLFIVAALCLFPNIKQTSRLLVEVGTLFCGVVLTEMTSCWYGDLYEVPVLCIYHMILLDRIVRYSSSMVDNFTTEARVGIFLAVIICLALIGPSYIRELTAAGYVAKVRAFPKHYRHPEFIKARGFSNMTIFGPMGLYPSHATYADKVNDALALVLKHPELNKKIIGCFEFTDCISTPLGRVSPGHMPLFLQYGFDISEKIYPDPAYIFSDCDAIMVTKYPDSDTRTLGVLTQVYRSFFNQNFKVIDESKMWILYERTTPHP